MFSMINFISRNARGISNKPTSRRIKKIGRKYYLPVISILQPKTNQGKMKKFLFKWNFDEVISKKSNKIWFFGRLGFKVELIKDQEKVSLKALMIFLESYEKASSHLINFKKISFYIDLKIPILRRFSIVHCLGVPFKNLPIKYLGCPLFKGRG